MTLCGLFAALLAVCAWICIPISDIGITLQTFGIFLALLLLAAAGIISMYQVRKERKYTSSFPAMGTVATVTLYPDEADFLNALKAVQESFAFVTALPDCRDPARAACRRDLSQGRAPAPSAPIPDASQRVRWSCWPSPARSRCRI